MKTNLDTFSTLLSDLCFKYVFSHEEILKDFINSFFRSLNLDISFKFTSVKAQDYIMPNNKKVHSYFGDLVATLDNDMIIDVEAYTVFKKRHFNKSFAYSTRLQSNNVKNTTTYDSKNIISLNLMQGNYRRINNDIVNTYMFCNIKSGKNITDNITLHLIRIDNACKIPYNKSETRFNTWLRLINTKSIEEMKDIVELTKGDKIMTDAMKFVEEWNAMSAKDGLERILNDKYYDGVDDGIIETAKNMLRNNFSISDVVKATKLSKTEVEKLQLELES